MAITTEQPQVVLNVGRFDFFGIFIPGLILSLILLYAVARAWPFMSPTNTLMLIGSEEEAAYLREGAREIRKGALTREAYGGSKSVLNETPVFVAETGRPAFKRILNALTHATFVPALTLLFLLLICAFVVGHIVDSLAHLFLERGLADRFFSRPFSSQLALGYPKSGFNWISNDAYLKNIYVTGYMIFAFFLLHSVGIDGTVGQVVEFFYFFWWMWMGVMSLIIVLAAAGRYSRGVLAISVIVGASLGFWIMTLAVKTSPHHWVLPTGWAFAKTGAPDSLWWSPLRFLDANVSWLALAMLVWVIAMLSHLASTFLSHFHLLNARGLSPENRVTKIENSLRKISDSFSRKVDPIGADEIASLSEPQSNGGGPGKSNFMLEREFLPGGPRYEELNAKRPRIQTAQEHYDLARPVRGAILLSEITCLRALWMPFIYINLVFGLGVKYISTALLLHRPLSQVLRRKALEKIGKATGLNNASKKYENWGTLDENAKFSILGSDIHAVAYFDHSEPHLVARERIRLQISNTVFARNLALALVFSGSMLGILWFVLAKGPLVGFSFYEIFSDPRRVHSDVFPAEQAVGIFLYFLGSILILRFLLLYYDSGRMLWRAYALSQSTDD